MAVFRWGTHWDPFAGLRVLQREMERLSWPRFTESRRSGGGTYPIKGTKKPLDQENGLKFIRRERGSGDFTRTIVLPDEVVAEKIEATLTDGVMAIRLPKAGAAEARHIEVKPTK